MVSEFQSTNRQSGVMLLEALLAILVFSVGILSLVGLQALAVNQSSDARYRSEAALLANELIAQMWVSDRSVAALQNNFNTGGAAYAPWLVRVQAALPGVIEDEDTEPLVNVDVNGVATVTVRWRAPNEPQEAAPRSYIVVAQMGVLP